MGKWKTELNWRRVEWKLKRQLFSPKAQKLQLHCDNFFSSCVSSIRYVFIFIFYLVYSWLILEYSNRWGAEGRGGAQ